MDFAEITQTRRRFYEKIFSEVRISKVYAELLHVLLEWIIHR